jgi:hypothetical protein
VSQANQSHQQPDTQNDRSVDENTSTDSGGFAQIAKRIRSRTTDLLAIAILCIGGLAVGGRLSEWWTTDPSEIPTPAEITESVAGGSAMWDINGSPVTLEFGEQPFEITRETVTEMDLQAVFKLMRQKCKMNLEKISKQPRLDLSQLPQQSRLVSRLETVEAIDERPGQWRIYQLEGVLPTVVGTIKLDERLVSVESNTNDLGVPVQVIDQPSDALSNDADTRVTARWAVICWSMAYPLGKQPWRIFSFVYSPKSHGQMMADMPEIQLPPNSRRVLAIRNGEGGKFIAFEGDGELDVWNRWIEQQDSRTGTVVGTIEGGRFLRDESKSGVSVHLQYQQVKSGALVGFVQIVTHHSKKDRGSR